jgi:hypothetical protein
MTRKISSLLALAVSVSFQAASAHAAEFTSPVNLEPLHGLSFEAGERHGVGYFVSEGSRCKLVLTVAADPNWDDNSSFLASRYEANVAAGKAARYRLSEGRSLEFKCNDGARAMIVQEQVNFANAAE